MDEKQKTVTVRMSEADHRKLKTKAREKGITVSEYIRRLILKAGDDKNRLSRIEESLEKSHFRQQLANSLYCRIAIEHIIRDQEKREKVEQDFTAIKARFGL